MRLITAKTALCLLVCLLGLTSCHDDDSSGEAALKIEEHRDSLSQLLKDYAVLGYEKVEGRYQIQLSNGQNYLEPKGMQLISFISSPESLPAGDDHTSYIEITFYDGVTQKATMIDKTDLSWSDLYGKRMVVAGGSFACSEEAKTAIDYWTSKLSITYKNVGVSGAGFSKKSGFQNMQNQVKNILNDPEADFDIFVLWTSTNDFSQGTEYLGEVNDYTAADGYDTAKLQNQCGGINYCIDAIRKANPEARIFFFTSLPVKKWGARSWDANYKGIDGMNRFVDRQREICKQWGIPFLDLFRYVDREQLSRCFKKDNLHLNEEGYRVIREQQLNFLICH